MKIKKAFTMAEAILVMTILGIIATIMITTLKPAEYKDKALKILSKKVLSEIDTATTQILINNSQNGTMISLMPGGASATTFGDNVANTEMLYKIYLTSIRKNCNTADCPCNSYGAKFYLKDGACVGLTATTTATNTILPGETANTSVTPQQGVIFFDINGEEGPNIYGKDQFVLPVNNSGIAYDAAS